VRRAPTEEAELRGQIEDAVSRGPQEVHRSMFRLSVAAGDVAWIADVNAEKSIAEIGIQNLRLVGEIAQLESLARGLVDLIADLRERPELAEQLLPVMKRADPAARRTGEHPLVWTVD
jgi:hypothetical protein